MKAKDQKLHIYHKGNCWELDPDIVSLKVRKSNGRNTCRLIVKLKGQLNASIRDFNKERGVLSTSYINNLDRTYYFIFPEMKIEALNEIADMYYKSGLVEYAEPEIVQHMQAQWNIPPNDPMINSQWIINNTGQQNGVSGVGPKILEAIRWIRDKQIPVDEKIIVAVLDEGVDVDHEDFKKPGLFVNGFSVFPDNNPKPKSGFKHSHGTRVAGIIASTWDNGRGVVGVNPYCKLMPGRIYYHDNGIDQIKMADGIRRAADNRANVINLSWKLQYSATIEDAIQHAILKGCIVCASSGNYLKVNDDKSVVFPGKLDQVLTVAAHDNVGRWINLNNAPKNYKFGSCFGREVDISAPGLYMATTLMAPGHYDHGFFGTSAACAVVSGIAALVWAINPTLRADEVKSILFTTANRPPTSGSSMEFFEKMGHGMVDALAAVKMAVGN
jgi:thermitase